MKTFPFFFSSDRPAPTTTATTRSTLHHHLPATATTDGDDVRDKGRRRRRRIRRLDGCVNRDPRILNDVSTRGDGALLAGLDDASDTSTHVRTRTNLGRLPVSLCPLVLSSLLFYLPARLLPVLCICPPSIPFRGRVHIHARTFSNEKRVKATRERGPTKRERRHARTRSAVARGAISTIPPATDEFRESEVRWIEI